MCMENPKAVAAARILCDLQIHIHYIMLVIIKKLFY